MSYSERVSYPSWTKLQRPRTSDSGLDELESTSYIQPVEHRIRRGDRRLKQLRIDHNEYRMASKWELLRSHFCPSLPSLNDTHSVAVCQSSITSECLLLGHKFPKYVAK